jgi:hypothetical protein
MSNLEISKLLKKTKLDLAKLPKLGKSSRSAPMPEEIGNNLQRLNSHFSQAKLSRSLKIHPTRVSRAISKAKRDNLNVRPSFVKVTQNECVAPSVEAVKGRVVLEMTTRSGMKLSIFE